MWYYFCVPTLQVVQRLRRKKKRKKYHLFLVLLLLSSSATQKLSLLDDTLSVCIWGERCSLSRFLQTESGKKKNVSLEFWNAEPFSFVWDYLKIKAIVIKQTNVLCCYKSLGNYTTSKSLFSWNQRHSFFLIFELSENELKLLMLPVWQHLSLDLAFFTTSGID